MKVSTEIVILLIIFFLLFVLTGVCIYFLVEQYKKYNNTLNTAIINRGFNASLANPQDTVTMSCEYGGVIFPNPDDSKILCLANGQYEDTNCDPFLYNDSQSNYGVANTNFVDVTGYITANCAGKSSCSISVSDLLNHYQTQPDKSAPGQSLNSICIAGDGTTTRTKCPSTSTLFLTGTYSCISKQNYQQNTS